MQENDENITALQYLKETYSNSEIFDNEKIMNMIELNYKLNFDMDIRNNIDYIKKKYTDIYNYIDIFKNDRNNVNYERLLDIIYENINHKYNYDIIYDNPEEIIEILKKQ